ncbi:MAG: hypothetical protein ACK5CF_06590 [Opitutaceae bacterium]|jgi:hypothetical protein
MKRLRLLSLTAAFIVSTVCGHADEVVDNLKSAIDLYQSGNYTEALQAMDFAGSVLRQKKSEAVAAILPAAPAGWTAQDPQTDGASAAILGGMVSAKRVYTKDEAEVSIQVQSDSPLLQSYGMMLANPALMAGSGVKLETVKGQRVAVTYQAATKNGDIKAVVDGRYVVSIEGIGVSREELTKFVAAIDFAKLSKLK